MHVFNSAEHLSNNLLNSVYVSALLQHKENFKEMDAQESQRLVRGQKDRLDYEVRKFRRRRLVQYHDLEQDLLREVRQDGQSGSFSDNIIDFQELNKRQLQLESAHSMLLRHHEMTQVITSEKILVRIKQIYFHSGIGD